jgi:hypothetical protein
VVRKSSSDVDGSALSRARLLEWENKRWPPDQDRGEQKYFPQFCRLPPELRTMVWEATPALPYGASTEIESRKPWRCTTVDAWTDHGERNVFDTRKT